VANGQDTWEGNQREHSAFPRVLIVGGAAFGSSSSSGITMTNLFRGWPCDCLAQVYGDAGDPDQGVCNRYWRFSSKDVPADRLVRRLLGLPAELAAAALPVVPQENPTARSTVHRVARAWADLFPYRLSRRFWEWVEEFKPDVIFSLLGSIRVMDLVLEIADRLGKPLVPHLMDDWPTTHYRETLLSLPPRLRIGSRLRAVFARSPVAMAISGAMAAEYEARFGVRFDAFMNCVETLDDFQPAPDDQGRRVQFVYVGGLHLERWRALQDIGKALHALRGEGLDVGATVYAPASDISRYGDAISLVPAMEVGGSLWQDQIAEVLRRADALLHVESCDVSVRRYTRLSLSTKLPAYMAAGRPILGYGPRELASIKYINDCECGIGAGGDSPEALLAALRRLATSASERERMGRRGQEVARQRHDANKERERFREVLIQAATEKVDLQSSNRMFQKERFG